MKNFSLKILAIVIGFAVWVLVNNIDDPVRTTTFNNIEVTLENESVFNELNKVYEIKNGGTINVTAKGKRSVLRRIKASDIVAKADLSQMSLTNAVEIRLYCRSSESVTLSADVNMLTISLEDKATARFKVDATTIGDLAPGYALGNIIVQPSLVRVSGAQSQIDRIADVRVQVDVEGASENFKTTAVPKAYDSKGKEITDAKLTFSSERVRVDIQVNDTKEVPVVIKIEGKPADGYYVMPAEYEPQTVTITGSEAALKKCDSIPITYDVTGKKDKVYEVIELADWLPAGISVVDESVTTINLEIDISQQKLQTVTLYTDDIEIKNLEDDYSYEFTVSKVDVEAIWASDSMSGTITSGDLNAYIDCSQLGEGVHTVSVKFKSEDKILVEADVTVSIRIQLKEADSVVVTKKPKTTVEPTLEPTAEPEDEEKGKDEEKE